MEKKNKSEKKLSRKGKEEKKGKKKNKKSMQFMHVGVAWNNYVLATKILIYFVVANKNT